MTASVRIEPANSWRRFAMLFAAFVMALGGVVGLSAPAEAATGDIRAPFTLGETWKIYQGYGPDAYSHHDNQTYKSLYGIDFTVDSSSTASAGKNARSPMAGTVQGYSYSTGSLCINTADGRSATLTHINSSLSAGDTVSAGEYVGKVAAAGDKQNNGIAHIHFQMWSSPGCWSTGNGGIPLDDAHNARICGETNLTANGAYGSNGKWSGTWITSYTCGSTTPTPPPDGDNDSIPDSSDLCPNNSGAGTTSGCPANRAIEQKGDFNGDEYSDVVVYYKRGDGGTNVWVFPGGANGVSAPINRAALADVPWTNVKVGGAGDVNGDNFDDAIMLYERQADGYTNVWMFAGSASGLQQPVFQFTQDMQWEKILVGGIADFDNNGYEDMVAYYKRGDGGTNVWVFPGSTGGVGTPTNHAALATWPWVNVKAGGVGDVNGDGFDDNVILYERQADGYTNVWVMPGATNGLQQPVFHRTQDMQWEKLIAGGVGDFDGDNTEDLLVYYKRGDGGTNVWVFPGSTTSSVGDPILKAGLTGWPWVNVKAGGVGDVNGDGYDDATHLYERQTDGYTNVWTLFGSTTGLQQPVFQRTQDMQWEKLLW